VGLKDAAEEKAKLDHSDGLVVDFNPEEKKGGVGVAWLVLPGIGQAADFATTVVGMKKGAVEGNPIVAPIADKIPVFAAVKLGIGVLQALAVKSLADNGHKKAAKIVSMVGFGLGAGPAIHNIQVMRRL